MSLKKYGFTTALKNETVKQKMIESNIQGETNIEKSVGISTYISNHIGFSGILKQRYTDFVVREVTAAGVVTHLESIESATLDSKHFTLASKGVENIDDVLLPIKIWLSGKLFKPVPPRATDNVPSLTLEAFKFVNCAPEPLKVEVIKPLAFIFVVAIPPSAFIIPLKDVAIALLYA
jgi:hypothetical protein